MQFVESFLTKYIGPPNIYNLFTIEFVVVNKIEYVVNLIYNSLYYEYLFL